MNKSRKTKITSSDRKAKRSIRFEFKNKCDGLHQLNQCHDPNQGVRSERPGFFSR